MFTGIIEDIGVIKEKRVNSLTIKTNLNNIKIGDSISVNGVCLTVNNIKNSLLQFDVSQQTLNKTNLSNLKVSNKVNLETSLTVNKNIGGHFVTGHIDGIGRIERILKKRGCIIWEVSIKDELLRFLVPQAPIAIDGVSLTVNEVSRRTITVTLVPYTLQNTTLQFKQIKDKVNIEVDIFGKYNFIRRGYK